MQTVTLQLPEPLYYSARQISKATKRSVEVVLRNSITHALPPLDDVPKDEAAELAAMALLSDAILWQETRSTMASDEQATLQELLYRQGSGPLTLDEEKTLESLLDLYGQLLVRQAHAWLLLARRGYQTPMQPYYETSIYPQSTT